MKLLSPSDFLKNTLILLLGTGLGQAIPILLQPVLRRVYSPEEFGAFAIYFSLFIILTVFTNFRYDLAIGLPGSDKESANLLLLTTGLNLLFNIFIFIVILLFKNDIISHLAFPVDLGNLLFILPVSMFFYSFCQSVNYWLIRKKAFRSISVNKVARRGAEGIIQVGSGIFRNPAGLFWGDLAGNVFNSMIGALQLKKTGFSLSGYSTGSIKELLKRYSHFPKYNLLPHLLGTIGMQYPVFIINSLYTKTDLGQFDLTQQALVFPFALITVSVSQVLMKKVTDDRNEKKPVLRDFLHVTAVLGVIGITALIIIVLFGPVLFSFVFGSEWHLAGIYSRTLIFGYIFYLVASPMNAVLISLEKVKTLGIWNVFHFLLMIGLGFIRDIPFPTFLKFFAIFQILSFSLFYLLTFNEVRKHDAGLKDLP